MTNSFAYTQKYLPILDEVYKAESKSAILDTPAANVQFDGTPTVKYFKTSMQGLGNYSRNTGFVTGDVTGTWESHTLRFDRGRSFMVDSMDDDETLGLGFGTLASEFIRTQVAPEIDAVTFATLAGTSNIDAGTPADLSSSSDVPALISAAEYSMAENEVPEEGKILFVSENCYRYLKDKIARVVLNGENGIQTAIESYDGMRLIRVPQARFYTSVTLADGSTVGQEAGGYAGTSSTGYKINFMIVSPDAVTKIAKHIAPRIFAPNVNQKADAYLFQYRIYHDAFVKDNKVKGIYLHRGSTALA